MLIIIFENISILFNPILKLTVFSIHYPHIEIIILAVIIKNH